MLSEHIKGRYDLYYTVIGIVLLLMATALFFYPVNAAPDNIFNMSVFSKNDNSITWNYSDDDAITKLSYDGISLTNFDAQAVIYTASDLTANSYHTLCAYSVDDFKCSTTNTTMTKNNSDVIIDYFAIYILFFMGCICIITGVIAEPLIGFGGFIFAIIGITTSINNSFIMGSLFCIMLIASIFVVFNKR